MCGIVACSSTSAVVSDWCVEGLCRLQYRGYDSFGFAWCGDGALDKLRSLDSLDEMRPCLPPACAMVGHTRWATHGGVSIENCHPHLAADRAFALVHNGIVENYQALYAGLVDAGRTFAGGTDTEVIVGRLEWHLAAGCSRHDAVRRAFAELEGRNTIVVLFADGELFGVRLGSPLVLGRAAQALFLASDVLSFAPWTATCALLPEGAVVRLAGLDCELRDAAGAAIDPDWQLCETDPQAVGLDGYRHYMIKEIMEQWRTVPAQAMVSDAAFAALAEAMSEAHSVIVTGAGGAFYAARQIAWLLREIAGLRAFDVAAYDIEGMKPCTRKGDVLLAVSQSGETADTLEAVRVGLGWGLRLASLVNMPMSTLSRLSEFALENRSGPEICVLSTKSASAQIAFGYLLAHAVRGDLARARAEIDALGRELSHYLVDVTAATVAGVAAHLDDARHLFVLGKGGHHGSALMGALNIKEASYVHAEAFTAGELKHGVLALIEPGVPVIVFVPEPGGYLLNVVAEVKSRGAFVIALGSRDNELFDAFIPLPAVPGPLQVVSAIVPCQMLAYYLALRRGLNPDKPRNLAKSVTVQ